MRPDSPVILGPVTISLPEAAALMQREVQKHQRHLAYCYERLRSGFSGIDTQLIGEFDQAPYTPEMYAELAARDKFASSTRSNDTEPGCWNADFTQLVSNRPLPYIFPRWPPSPRLPGTRRKQ